jgi:SNF2 family DNA or RNA helicase
MIKPLAHQTESLKFMKTRERVFDASDPGTGKTYVEIIDFATRRRKKGGCALILGTKSILDVAWAADFDKFAPDMTISVAYASNREDAFKRNVDAYITNIDAAVWLAKKPPSFFKKFDTLIVDESTTIKHHTSLRSKAVGKIAKHFKWRRLLSGTPNTNGVTDLWHQYLILDDGVRLGKSFYAFRSATGTAVQIGPNAHALQWTDKPGIENVVGALVKDITIRHKFENCVDIPANFLRHVDFALSATHYRSYKELEAFSVLETKTKTVTAVNAAVLYGKLLQAASGAVYSNESAYELLSSERYQLVLDLVQERQHSVVFFLWQHQKDQLTQEATKRKLKWALIDGTVNKKGERERIVNDYQAGKYDVLFAHPQSTAHGITLTRGTATIWASPTNNLEWWKQGLKRIHRIGQTQKTETIMVIAKDTIDERVWDALQGKDVKLKNLLYELE